MSVPDPLAQTDSPSVQSLEQEFPDNAALITRLRHRDQAFRRLASYYESLHLNIQAIETGREEASPAFLAMLRTQRDQARKDITHILTDAPPY